MRRGTTYPDAATLAWQAIQDAKQDARWAPRTRARAATTRAPRLRSNSAEDVDIAYCPRGHRLKFGTDGTGCVLAWCAACRSTEQVKRRAVD